MDEYVFKLGEFSGSDILEFRKKDAGAARKFVRQDSLYVLDNAFYFFLESIFQEVVVSFDMFESTYVTKEEWKKIMNLDISEIVCSKFVNEAKETLSAIDRWVTEEIGENEGFIVIGV